MKTIGLIKTFSQHSGGNVYRDKVIKALSGKFDIQAITFEGKKSHNKYLRTLEAFWKLFSLAGQRDAWIRDFYSTLTISRRTKGKNIPLIFHVDFSGYPFISRLVFTALEKFFFYRKLKQANAIIVMSEFWKQFFLQKGFKNLHTIYCGFDLSEFNITDKEVEEFRRQHNLAEKIIIYIGNCQKAKGVIDAYEALKDLDVILVTSGKKEVDIPVMNLYGTRREYVTLLKAASVAVTMSTFKEGWCMTAHEAMLCRTPVIGSGLGGMRELLEGGKQIICTKENLRETVIRLLTHRDIAKQMGEDGYAYAKQFTQERFNNAWVQTMNQLV